MDCSYYLKPRESEYNCRAVFSGRIVTNQYLETEIDKYCDRYQIKPLSLTKVVQLIKGLCENISTKDRLIEDLKSSAIYKALPKTPIAAIVLANLINEGVNELPSNMTELYAQYCELSLGRWDADRGLSSIKEYEVSDAVISDIAAYMIENEIPCLSYLEALDFFKKYLSQRNLEIDAEEIFKRILERSDILFYERKHGTVAFKHRSFCEFYYAKKMDRKNDVVLGESAYHPYWSGAYYFYVGLKQDCPEILEALMNVDVRHEGLRLSKIVNYGGFLLAAYKSPYDYVKNGIKSIFDDAGRYYYSVSEEGKESLLSQFPRMHLLGLFRALMKETYSYSFFGKAIDEVFEDLATVPNPEPHHVYSMYLIDVVREDVGSDNAFVKLVDIYDGTLPLVIQLAISSHVSKNGLHASPAMKKLEKRLRKNARGSRAFSASLRKLYQDSIDSSVDYGALMKGKKLNKKDKK